MPEMVRVKASEPLPSDVLARVKTILDSGGVIVYPTNTLYGLGASIRSEAGIRLVFRIKSRPEGMPLSVMASASQIAGLCEIGDMARRFLDSGDIRVSIILPALDTVPEGLVHRGTLAVRLPCSPLTASLVEHCGPITSTSANIHGESPPSTVEQALAQVGDSSSLYIDSERVGGTASTLIDLTDKEPKIIRQGALSEEEARRIYER